MSEQLQAILDSVASVKDDVAGIKQNIDGTVAAIFDAKIQPGQETILADVEELKASQGKLDEFLQEVEGKVNSARYGGSLSGGCDQVKNAIPDRHRKALDMICRTPGKFEDHVKTVAMESWLKNFILSHNPQISRVHGKLFEEMDAIEKSFGFEPVSKALQEGTDSEGGYTVPTVLEAEVLRTMANANIVRSLCRIFPMSTLTHNFPSLSSNLSVAIVAEEGTITPNDPAFSQAALTAKKIAARCITSMELVQDSAIGIMSFLVQLMTEQQALLEEDQVLEGDGTGSNFTGVVAASGVLTVTNGTNGVATPVPAKFVEQKWKSTQRAARRNGAYVMAPQILQKIESLRSAAHTAGDTEGPFLYTPNAGQGGIMGTDSPMAGMLHGNPAYDSDQISGARTVGSLSTSSNCYFGNWKSVIIGDLLGLTFGVSEHTNWATGQLDLRMIKRTGILCSVPAQMVVQSGLSIA